MAFSSTTPHYPSKHHSVNGNATTCGRPSTEYHSPTSTSSPLVQRWTVGNESAKAPNGSQTVLGGGGYQICPQPRAVSRFLQAKGVLPSLQGGFAASITARRRHRNMYGDTRHQACNQAAAKSLRSIACSTTTAASSAKPLSRKRTNRMMQESVGSPIF